MHPIKYPLHWREMLKDLINSSANLSSALRLFVLDHYQAQAA
jgi:predicted DNA-binding ribbon-helix-helix protein